MSSIHCEIKRNVMWHCKIISLCPLPEQLQTWIYVFWLVTIDIFIADQLMAHMKTALMITAQNNKYVIIYTCKIMWQLDNSNLHS